MIINKQEVKKQFQTIKDRSAPIDWDNMPTEEVYLLVKAHKAANCSDMYEYWQKHNVDVHKQQPAANWPSTKEPLRRVMSFYETEKLQCCHPINEGKSPIEIYSKIAKEVFGD